jgi:hypothetical protein
MEEARSAKNAVKTGADIDVFKGDPYTKASPKHNFFELNFFLNPFVLMIDTQATPISIVMDSLRNFWLTKIILSQSFPKMLHQTSPDLFVNRMDQNDLNNG